MDVATVHQAYNELVENTTRSSALERYVPEYNAVSPHPVGRPLEASEAQCAGRAPAPQARRVLQTIADETNLGMQTVRTIIGKANGPTARPASTRPLKPEDMAAWRARKRTRDALPRRVNALLKDKAELLKEAKGLKWSRAPPERAALARSIPLGSSYPPPLASPTRLTACS